MGELPSLRPCSHKTLPNTGSIYSNSVKLVILNCQSIKNKVTDFREMIESLAPDITLGSESWLTSEHCSEEFFPGNFTVHRRDRADGYGGVFIAHPSSKTLKREIELETDCELVICSMLLKNGKKAFFFSFYRPNDLPNHIDELTRALKLVHLQNKDPIIVIGGDFNFPGINWDNYAHMPSKPYPASSRNFLDLLGDFSLEQLNRSPTRGDSILELLITNRPESVLNIGTDLGIGDHGKLVVSDFLLSHKACSSEKRTVLQFNKADWTGFKNYITSKLSENILVLSRPMVDEKWQHLKTAIAQGIDIFVPKKQFITVNEPLWYTTEIRRIRRQQRVVRNRLRNETNPKLKAKFAKSRAELKKLLGKTHAEFKSTTLETSLKSNPKFFWKYVKSLRKNNNSPVNALINNNKQAGICEMETANLLNLQFQSVFTVEDENMTAEIPMLTNQLMPKILVGCDGVRNLLLSLDSNKSPGPDKIAPRVLKELANEISPFLTDLFQQSLESGAVPREWKDACICPIFKSGSELDPANYRPVSLTSIVCKVLEHIIYTDVMQHLNSHALITDTQHGFRRGRSCETQLALFVHDIQSKLDSGKEVDAVFIDFAKAFDTVPHLRLLKKLKTFGIHDQVLLWIKSFLSNRRQKVVINGQESGWVDVQSGVPQGSVLGPLLFLLFVNDLPNILLCNSKFFADDSSLYDEVRFEEPFRLQRDLDTLSVWCKTWQLKLNEEKCLVMRFSRKRMKTVPDYHLEGTPLKVVSSIKYLGIIITDDMRWNTQIEKITGMANQRLRFVQRIFRNCPQKVKETGYFSLVRPLVEYCSTIWNPYRVGQVQEIEMVQRRAARFVMSNYRRDQSVTVMIKSLQWDSLRSRREAHCMGLFDKFVTLANSHLVEGIFRRNLRGGRHCHSNSLMEIHARSDPYYWSYFLHAIRRWNSLPKDSLKLQEIQFGNEGIGVPPNMGVPLAC